MTKVVTGRKTRFSFPNLFVAKANESGDNLKYGICLLIPKEDKATVNAIEKAIEKAKQLGKEGKWGGSAPRKFESPLRDGDEKAEDGYPEFEGHYYINASSKLKPAVVNNRREVINEPTEVKAGDYGRASINFYPYNFQGKKGVAAGLNSVQKLMDGEPLGSGFSNPDEDFDIEEEYDVDDLM